MKKLALLSGPALAAAWLFAPTQALATYDDGLALSLPMAISAPAITTDDGSDEFARRGRSKPRIPGGSGCDDPEDLIEHPECRA